MGEPCAPRYQGPLECLSREAGRPWAPPPRCVLLKAVLFCVWHLVRDPASCLGNVKRFVALGLLSSFGCPLSFGPVRSAFSPLFSLSLVRLLSANVALSLSLSGAGEMQTMFGLHFPLCFFFLAAAFSLDPYFFLITFTKAPRFWENFRG